MVASVKTQREILTGHASSKACSRDLKGRSNKKVENEKRFKVECSKEGDWTGQEKPLRTKAARQIIERHAEELGNNTQ